MSSLFVLIVTMVSMFSHEIHGESASSFKGDSQWEIMKRLSPGHVEIEEFPCGFDEVNAKYHQNCRTNYLMDLLMWSPENRMVTGEQLLEQVATACSRYTEYKSCAENFTRGDCPDQKELAFANLMWKWSIFCERDQVSEWLQTILENDFRFNQTCVEPLDTCISILNLQYPYTIPSIQQVSLSEGIDFFQLRSSALLKCLIGENVERAEYLRKECGSSWQNVLLVDRLKSSCFPGVGFNLGPFDIKMLQEIRC